MPLYSFKCTCSNEFDVVESMRGEHEKRECPECGQIANRIWDTPTLITDTSFAMTGIRDPRFDNQVVEGRKDWKKKLASKGYVELTQKQANME